MAQTISFFFFLLLILVSSTISNSTLHPVDRNALSEIKNNLKPTSSNSFLSTWNFASPNPCTSFSGILCTPDPPTNTFRVSSLTLGTGLAGDSPGLAGKLSPAIANLSSLTQLIINAGKISGRLPPELGNLKHLSLLSITNNFISGQIPPSLSNLLDLHTLDLGYNQINGQVPPDVTTLPELKVLILAGNRLSGVMPTIKSPLLHLDLRSNAFSGRLPQLPLSLRYLSLSENQLWGPLDNLCHLPDLGFVDLSMNAFSGGIPESIFVRSKQTELSSLLLQRNNLSGSIPLGPTDRPSLVVGSWASSTWTVVDLSHNFLSGELTNLLAGVETLYLNNNRFTGTVPGDYVTNVYGGSIKTLYLQHNYLSGFPLPPETPLPDSALLCVSYNCMVPPVEPTSCPASAGDQVRRPAYQCEATRQTTT